MPKTIYDVKLSELIPLNMTAEPEAQAMCAAIDAQTAYVTDALKKVLVLANIQGQSNQAVNLLALQMHVDYYNQSLPIETRRNLVAGSGALHRIKGTKAAVEQVLKTVFGSAQVQEWFEYGGDPYTFRVTINEFPNAQSQMDEVNRAIECTKNARSKLDKVVVIAPTTKANMYMAGVIQISVNISTVQNPV